MVAGQTVSEPVVTETVTPYEQTNVNSDKKGNGIKMPFVIVSAVLAIVAASFAAMASFFGKVGHDAAYHQYAIFALVVTALLVIACLLSGKTAILSAIPILLLATLDFMTYNRLIYSVCGNGNMLVGSWKMLQLSLKVLAPVMAIIFLIAVVIKGKIRKAFSIIACILFTFTAIALAYEALIVNDALFMGLASRRTPIYARSAFYACYAVHSIGNAMRK